MYMLTPLYYLLPKLSTFIPSSVVAGVPCVLMFVLFITTAVTHRWQVGNQVIRLFEIICVLLLFAFCGNEYMSDIVFSTSFLAVSIFSLYILSEFKKINVYQHFAFFVLLTVAVCMCGIFNGLYSENTSVTSVKLNYMSFGYTMSLMSMFLLEFGLLTQKSRSRVFYILTGLTAAFFACMFGNRGALIVIILYALFRWLKWCKRKSLSLQKVILALFFLGMVAILGLWYMDELLLKLVDLCDELGFESRTLLMLMEDNFVKSDRSQIYSNAFELIKESPFSIRGPGAILEYTTHGYNAHNIVIELCVEYGVIIAAIISFLIFKCFWRIMKLYLCDESFDQDIREKISFAFVLFMHSLVLLMFSSTLYECNGFWLGICASIVIIRTINNQNLIIQIEKKE